MNEEKNSRFAELAMELFGAKETVSFLREAWAAASPESKTAIADALVGLVLAETKKDSYAIHRVVDDEIAAMTRTILKDKEPELRARVSDALSAERIESTVRHVIDDLSARLRKEAAEGLTKLMDDFRRGFGGFRR